MQKRNPSRLAQSISLGKTFTQLDAPAFPAEPRESRVLSQAAFLNVVTLERKRSDRSDRRFVLMLLRLGDSAKSAHWPQFADQIFATLLGSIRNTDQVGWYQADTTIGTVFTEIGQAPSTVILEALLAKIGRALQAAVGNEQFENLKMTLHIYPEDRAASEPPPRIDSALYPDLNHHISAHQIGLGIKRLVDIVGSLTAIIFCSPILLFVALLIKSTSKGPILFRQERIGHYGKRFTFLKFRSMRQNNDHSIHKEYVTKLIASKAEPHAARPGGSAVYKLTRDPRVTPIGKILRRTSLDELPQLFNVLAGNMSLVGPRPPIPYEFAAYATWHRKRLLLVKPGITGLWQIAGRSRVTFDEMVRLDLRYAASWSLWLDFSILLQTPRAVIAGQGAY